MRYHHRSDVFSIPGYGEGAGILDVLRTGVNHGLKYLKGIYNEKARDAIRGLANRGADYVTNLGSRLIDSGISATGGGVYLTHRGGATHLAGRGRRKSSRSRSRSRSKGKGMRRKSRSRSRSSSRKRSSSGGSAISRRSSRSRSRSKSPISLKRKSGRGSKKSKRRSKKKHSPLLKGVQFV